MDGTRAGWFNAVVPVRCTKLAFAVACLCTLLGCRQEPRPTVVVYVSADEHIAREVIQAFERATGIAVSMLGDTEVKKTAGLVQRLRDEAASPRADVFWSSEVFMTIELAEQGVLEPFESPTVADWPPQWRHPQRLWHGFAGRIRVLAYAPARVPDEQAPRTWMELTNSRFKGRIVMADPRFGTTGGHLGAMKTWWDHKVMAGYYEAWLDGLADNGARLLPSGNAGVVEAVASGEADVGLTDSDDIWAAQARGLDVRMAVPRHAVDEDDEGGGTLLIPNTAALVKGGPNPANARKFLDFLLSAEVERTLAASVSRNIPLRPELAADFAALMPVDPLRVDMKLAARNRLKAIDAAMRRLGSSSASTSVPRDAPTPPDGASGGP